MGANPDKALLEALLAEESLHRYLAPLDNMRSNVAFPLREVEPQVRSSPPSLPIEGRMKKPRVPSPIRANSDDFLIPSGGPSVEILIIRQELSRQWGQMVTADLPRNVWPAREAARAIGAVLVNSLSPLGVGESSATPLPEVHHAKVDIYSTSDKVVGAEDCSKEVIDVVLADRKIDNFREL